MPVIPHDHVLRFRVQSDARPEIEHVVDLGSFDGFGRCSCENFEFRLMPELMEGRTPPARCKHLIQARDHLVDEVIARIIAQDPSTYETPA